MCCFFCWVEALRLDEVNIFLGFAFIVVCVLVLVTRDGFQFSLLSLLVDMCLSYTGLIMSLHWSLHHEGMLSLNLMRYEWFSDYTQLVHMQPQFSWVDPPAPWENFSVSPVGNLLNVPLGWVCYCLVRWLCSAIIGNTNWPVILSPCVAVWLDPWGKAGIIALNSNMLNWKSLRTSMNPSFRRIYQRNPES